jgi:hypothetical protein
MPASGGGGAVITLKHLCLWSQSVLLRVASLDEAEAPDERIVWIKEHGHEPAAVELHTPPAVALSVELGMRSTLAWHVNNSAKKRLPPEAENPAVCDSVSHAHLCAIRVAKDKRVPCRRGFGFLPVGCPIAGANGDCSQNPQDEAIRRKWPSRGESNDAGHKQNDAAEKCDLSQTSCLCGR